MHRRWRSSSRFWYDFIGVTDSGCFSTLTSISKMKNLCNSEGYSEPSQTFNMKHVAQMVNDF